jgi:hypothetical protein
MHMKKLAFTALLLLGALGVNAQSVVEQLFLGLPMKGNCKNVVNAAVAHTKLSVADESGQISLEDGRSIRPNYAGFFDGHPLLKKAGKQNVLQVGCLEDGAWIAVLGLKYQDLNAMNEDLKMLISQLGSALGKTHEVKQRNGSILFYHTSNGKEEGVAVAWGNNAQQGTITIIYRRAEATAVGN